MNVCEPLRKSTSDSKINLGEIHKSHGLDWAFLSLPLFSLAKTQDFFYLGELSTFDMGQLSVTDDKRQTKTRKTRKK